MGGVLILTTEPLPIAGMPATGAGLRAWSLGLGLRAAGLEVTLLMPADAALTYAPPGSAGVSPVILTPGDRAADAGATPALPGQEGWVGTFRRDDGGAGLRDAVRARRPDVIVLQHWGLAAELGEVDCPLAIDLAGPHLLERKLWGSIDPEGDLHAKLDALRRADFLTASGRYQRHYFLPYLALAGWDATAPDALPVIPFSWPAADPPAPTRIGAQTRFIYGGYLLPWQDPTLLLDAAMEAMTRADRGELLFIGGAHPRLDVSRGRFEPLLQRLAAHPRVRMLGPMPFDDYWKLLLEGGIALDLMARNAERELAFTTRTVLYLAAGIPVIHDDYSELGGMIGSLGAGLTFNPESPEIRQTLHRILDSLLNGELNHWTAPRGAHALAESELDPLQTARPLIEFCRAPRLRADKTSVRLAFEEQGRLARRLAADLESAQADLATLRGKRWVRWGLALASGHAWMRAPLALFTAIVSLALIPIFWVNDRLAKSSAKR